MEFFDIYDANGQYLNKTAVRGEKLDRGEFFLVIHVWIENERGEFLIQKRAKKNDPIPYQWAITSGIPNVEESPLDAAIRETEEELGIKLTKNKLKKRARIVSSHNQYNTITHVYHTDEAIAIEDLALNPKEVLAVEYAHLSRIKAMVERGEFWDYRELLACPDYFSILERSD